MKHEIFALSSRRSTRAFWSGSILVSVGVLLHLPMFWMGRNTGFRLAGMPMDPSMRWGMALIMLGILTAGYGLLPISRANGTVHDGASLLEDAPLSSAHWMLMAVLSVALVIDVMKPASLGFVTPGMRVEYGLNAATVALLPLSALIGTSICGAMPSFRWNVAMCFLMGAAAGGLLPIAYALLAEIMPTRHRGWSLVLVGGIGTIGGYYAASESSALLQPFFGWRIMWFINLPTGLILIALSPLIPESAGFLQHMGRFDALAWGFVNFAILLWLPGSLVAAGRSVGLMTLGLSTVLLRSLGAVGFLDDPIAPLSLLIVGSTALISILLPYATENYPVRVRGRTGNSRGLIRDE